MAGAKDTDYFKKLLLDFISKPDPPVFHAAVAHAADDGVGIGTKGGCPQGEALCRADDPFFRDPGYSRQIHATNLRHTPHLRPAQMQGQSVISES